MLNRPRSWTLDFPHFEALDLAGDAEEFLHFEALDLAGDAEELETPHLEALDFAGDAFLAP